METTGSSRPGTGWHGPEGYRTILRVSLPLVASMGSTTLMFFTDRIFLARYGVDAIAAAVPAGLLAFTFSALFLGVASYVNTFVAQYTGSQQHDGVGRALWQGLYFALASSILLAAGSLLAGPLFRLAGHEAAVQELEIIYFRILMLGAGFSIIQEVLSCFFSGRGLTRVIMLVTCTGACINIPLDYALINGVWGMPAWGIFGAGVATVAGHAIMAVLYTILVFSRPHRRNFPSLGRPAFNPALFLRLLRFGGPAGLRFFMDIFSFSFFLFVVGRLGTLELAASNIAFAINTLAFLPMVGFSIGTATLVGQALGRDDPRAARRVTLRTLNLTLVYMVGVALAFLLFPGPLVALFFSHGTQGEDAATIQHACVVVLRFVAAYTFIDGINVVLSGTLNGAGDSRFVGWTIAVGSTSLFMLPVFLGVTYFGAGLPFAWSVLTFYVFAIAGMFTFRYRGGAWETMRVIEPHPPPVPPLPGVPAIDDVL